MKNRNDPNYLLAKRLKELLVFPWKPDVTDIEHGKKKITFKSFSTKTTFLEKLGALTNSPEYKEILRYEDDVRDVSVTLSAKGLDQFLELLARKTSTSTITESENISKAETYNNQEKGITNIELSINTDPNEHDFDWEKHKANDWKTAYSSDEAQKINNSIEEQLRQSYSPLKFFCEDCSLTENETTHYAKKIAIFYKRNQLDPLNALINKIMKFTENRYNSYIIGDSEDSRLDFVLSAKDLNNFLEDSLQKTNQPVQKNLDTRIADKASFYVKSKQNAENSTLFFNLNAYRQLCDHNITVLEEAQSFLNDQISIADFLDIQHRNYRWVEGMEPRQLIEEAISNKLKDIIPPENLALSAKMAKKINEYQKNIESEQNSFFENEDKIELWQHKIDALQQSQLLLHDNNKFDSAAFQKFIEHKHRWAEGKETTALVEEMKRLKGIPEEIIALDTKISRQISIYKRKYEDTYNSFFSFNKEYNLALWKAKIDILEAAKAVLYDTDAYPTLSLMMIDQGTNWSKGKVTKALVDKVNKMYNDRITIQQDRPTINLDRYI